MFLAFFSLNETQLEERGGEAHIPATDPVCAERGGLHKGARENASLFGSGNGAAAAVQKGGQINGSV